MKNPWGSSPQPSSVIAIAIAMRTSFHYYVENKKATPTQTREEMIRIVQSKPKHEDRVMEVRARIRYCKWCGADIESSEPILDPSLPEYCNKQHAHQASKMRNRRRRRTVAACPTSNKRRYYNRGDAIVWAAIYNQYAYACQCQFYHLTSEPPTSPGFEPMNDLVEKRKVEYASFVASKKSMRVSVDAESTTVEVSEILNAYTSKYGDTLQSQIDTLWVALHEVAGALAELKRPKPDAMPLQTPRSLSLLERSKQVEQVEQVAESETKSEPDSSVPRRPWSRLMRWRK